MKFGRGMDTVIVFIPSQARDNTRVADQDQWASEALDLRGKLYGGATGFKDLVGIYRDDDGELLTDEPIMIQSLANREDVEKKENIEELAAFLKRMGKQTRQA